MAYIVGKYFPFHFIYGFLCCVKAFKFNQVPFETTVFFKHHKM